MSIKFSGINIMAKDPVKSFEFYKGLGLPVSEEASPDDKYYGASFHIGDGAALWIWRDDGGNDTENTGRMTIQIVLGMGGLENMQKNYQAYKAKGYAISEPEKQFYGGWEMQLTDPDGNKILFLD